MDAALLEARLLLASVFVVAGVAKLADRAGSRQAMADFGVPTLLAVSLRVLAADGGARSGGRHDIVRCGNRGEPAIRPQIGVALLRAAALRACRLEHPRA